MKSVNNEMELFKAIMKMIAKQFGDKCEVVLHDWSGGYDKTIVAIEMAMSPEEKWVIAEAI